MAMGFQQFRIGSWVFARNVGHGRQHHLWGPAWLALKSQQGMRRATAKTVSSLYTYWVDWGGADSGALLSGFGFLSLVLLILGRLAELAYFMSLDTEIIIQTWAQFHELVQEQRMMLLSHDRFLALVC